MSNLPVPEFNERVRLLRADIEKLLRAHTDSLPAQNANLVQLDAAGQVFAGVVIESLREHIRNGKTMRDVEQYLVRFPWGSTLMFHADKFEAP